MANKRVFYAVQRVGIAPLGSNSFTSIRGLQTVGITTTFNLEQAFEIGQLAIYENIEGIPDVEVNLEKLLDGYSPIYCLATQLGTSASLAGRSNGRCHLALGIYNDDLLATSGNAQIAVELSGLYVNSVSFSVPVEGMATESVTLVGNNKVWKNGTQVTWADEPFCWNTDAPTVSGVQRRENVRMGTWGSRFPTEIPGIGTSGWNIDNGAEGYRAHLQNFSTSTDFGREQMFELGRRGPYHRFMTFPVEVTTEITMLSSSGDGISATEEGLYGSSDACGDRYNLQNQTIYLKMCDGLHVDLGAKNKLASITLGGGDATGGNAEITYTYTNFNDFIVYHRNDPRAAETAFQPTYKPAGSTW